MKIDLIRIEEGDEGTFGVLRMWEKVFCVTLEPCDKDNQKNISNIPPGVYLCEKTDSPKYGLTFWVKHVPERSAILFHAGNTVDHTKGCILLGEYFGKLKGDRAVLNSGKTFKRFMERLKYADAFALNIIEV